MPYGIITNCIAVFLGGVLGAFLKNPFSSEIKRKALPQYLWPVSHYHGNQPYYHVKKSVSRGTGPYRGNGHRRTSEPGG